MIDSFVHVPKASGSTLRTILSRQYGVDHILYFEPGAPSWQGAHPKNFLQKAMGARRIDLITGHYPFGVHAIINEPCRSFTFIRDPISRALSEYYYAYSYPHHRLREEILSGRLSPEEFISEPRFGLLEAQIQMLAGRWGASRCALSVALENVRHCFVAVGTAERFEESVLLLAKTLGWAPPLFVRKNVTRLSPDVAAKRKEVESEIRGRFTSLFSKEYSLYSTVATLLAERIANEGDDFQLALQCYKGIQSEIDAVSESQIYELYEFAGDDVLPEFAARFVGSRAYKIIQDYLASAPAHVQTISNYVGFVDQIEGSVIAGWAKDIWSELPIEVKIYHSGSLVAAVLCDRHREDVAQGYGGRANVGFRLELTHPVGDAREYQICFEDTAVPLLRAGSA